MERPNTSQGTPLDIEKIYETLFVFIDDVLFQYRFSTRKSGENDITQDLAFSLNEKTYVNDMCFAFLNQYQKGIYTTDIGVCLRSNQCCFCWIEAKRLPTPNKKNRDEREYVIVSQEKKEDGTKKFKGNGGIQRFKEGKHASECQYSIMIGYIQDNNTVNYWLSKINAWITDLTSVDNRFWTKDDCLKKYVSNKCARFLSTHKRKDEKKITLHHYWITM